MRVIDELVAAAGIDPREGPAEQAALLVRRQVLRTAAVGPSTPEEIVAAGWCDLEGLAGLFEEITGQSRRTGAAFGQRWPWFEVGTRLVAPALPVRLKPSTEEDGPDGVYSRHEDQVDRESIGRRQRFLSCKDSANEPPPESDLLVWFSSTARFLMTGGVLEIEDLFSRTSFTPSRDFIELQLVRSKRVGSGVLEGVDCPLECGPAMIEMSRPVSADDERLVGPEAFLEGRLDIETVERRGNEVVLRDVRGERSVLELVHTSLRRWSLEKRQGLFPLERLEVVGETHRVDLFARLPADVAVEKPGVRERWVFDLHADLRAALNRSDRTQNE